MHELSVIQALLLQVEAVAAARGAAGVRRVTVQVGPLSGVEPALLDRAFAALRAGCCAQAELVIETPRIRLRCRECGTESDARPNRILCAACGGFKTTLLSGDELILRQVELERPAEARPVEVLHSEVLACA